VTLGGQTRGSVWIPGGSLGTGRTIVSRIKRQFAGPFFLALSSLALSAGVAGAHVTVEPREAPAGASQPYAVRVPTEKAVPTTRVRVEFPSEVIVSRFLPKPGWTREVEKDSAGRLTAVAWSGGEIAADEYEEFGFIARNPRQPGKIAWKAYQTYQDGQTVAWVGSEGADEPASVTTITAAPTGAPAEREDGPPLGSSPPSSAPPGLVANEVVPRMGGRGSDLALVAALGAFTLAVVALILAIVGLRRPAPEGR